MAVNDGYLYSVQSDADPDDGRLQDPTIAGPVTLTLVGIASAEAVGAPSIGATVAPSGIASAEAVGAPTLTVSLLPVGIASAEAVGVPTITLVADRQTV